MADKALRVRNVTLHSEGRSEHGTLTLEQHHLVFSYHPKAKSKPAQVAGDGGVNVASAQSTPTLSAESSANLTDGGGQERKSVPPPKSIWVPYPMINHCLFRPGHAQGYVLRSQADGGGHPNPTNEAADDLFPPTFGTASYGRPSTDSARLAPYSTPPRPSSPSGHVPDGSAALGESGRQPAIRIRRRDFQMMALHFHPTSPADKAPEEAAREVFYALRRRCRIDKVEDFHAFHFHPSKKELAAGGVEYDACREYARMGIGGKAAADGPGAAWRISDINRDYSYSATYPSVLCVPSAVSDNTLKHGAEFRSRSRIPCLTYLHSNGGSITRSSQPLVGVGSKRSRQDEKLVSAIFSSHTPSPAPPTDGSPRQEPSLSSLSLEGGGGALATADGDIPGLPLSRSDTALDEDVGGKAAQRRTKIYGSSRQNLIVDARPKFNALANKATGGGMEDVANYTGNGDVPVERMFLNIANIHVMRASLEKVVDSLANSDYIKMPPNQEALRKSGWLGHIANMLHGSEIVARAVGLGGSHVLIHCSDGWDRTSQVAALAQIMLDPHYRTLRGFVTLVQKDFLSFGHKFRDRDGIEGSEKWFEIENERVAPSRARETNHSDPTSLNSLGSKALSGAKNWFEKNRGALFRQQDIGRDNLAADSPPRPPSPPPPNPVLHSPPSSNAKDEGSYKTSEKEIAPIFQQFLDAVWQLLSQSPGAFEFNDRFLKRLFYHTYACQYGEFLFNNERERTQCRPAGAPPPPSVWAHFLDCSDLYRNPDYAAAAGADDNDGPLLFPKRHGVDREVDVRWWTSLFGRRDDEMNVPRPPALSSESTIAPGLHTAASSFDDSHTHTSAATADVNDEEVPALNGTIKEAKSTPSLASVRSSFTNSFSSLGVRAREQQPPLAPLPPPPQSKETGLANHIEKGDDEETVDGVSSSPSALEKGTGHTVASPASRSTANTGARAAGGGGGGGGLDFAAFASQNAFRER